MSAAPSNGQPWLGALRNVSNSQLQERGKAVDTDYPPEWPVMVQNENKYKQISDPDV